MTSGVHRYRRSPEPGSSWDVTVNEGGVNVPGQFFFLYSLVQVPVPGDRFVQLSRRGLDAGGPNTPRNPLIAQLLGGVVRSGGHEIWWRLGEKMGLRGRTGVAVKERTLFSVT